MPKRILLTGGPSTGKTTLLNYLQSLGYKCLVEISREVIKEAQQDGIEQLFLKNPLLFSKLLCDARVKQFTEANTLDTNYVFYDRGIPDTVAYMDFIEQEYTQDYTAACKAHTYDQVFILPPWEDIHITDSERYESFKQAQDIHQELLKTYKKYNYTLIEVPLGKIKDRAQFIITKLQYN